MKRSIIICLLILGTNLSFAQIQRTVKQKTDSTSTTTEPGKKKGDGSRKEMFRELDLTREQKVKMKEINQSMKASKDAIETDSTLSEPVKKEILKTLRKDQAQKIQAILTEEQKIKFRELRAKKEGIE